MQTKAIQVGTDYAVQEGTYRKAYRATVLETGVTTEVKEYAGFGGSRMKTLTGVVKVEAVSGDFVTKGEVLYVKPQYVKRTWSEEHASRVSAGKAQAARLREKAGRRKQRAEQAFTLHEALVAKGAKVGLSYCYHDENHAALLAAGFEPAEKKYGRSEFKSALNGLSDLMEKGTVDLDQMTFLLLGTEMPEPHDSPDNYDFDEEV